MKKTMNDPRIGKRVLKRHTDPDEPLTPLAFVFGSNDARKREEVTVVRWADAALTRLDELEKRLKPRAGVPITTLRTRLELADQNILRINCTLNPSKNKAGFLFTTTCPEDAARLTEAAILGWLTDDVAPLVTSLEIPEAGKFVASLKDLARKHLSITVSRRQTDVFQWTTTPSRTAKNLAPHSYSDLTDYLARFLEGKVVFPGLSPLRRIVTGDIGESQIELMTDPVDVGTKNRFSLVLRLKVMTHVGQPFPVVVTEFTKRVWLTGIKEKAQESLTAYAFPAGRNQAIRFSLTWDKEAKIHRAGRDFAPINRTFFDARLEADQIVKEGYALTKCPLLVSQRGGVAVKSDSKSGVPDADKMTAFRELRSLLAQVGFTPFTGWEIVDSPTRPVKDLGQGWSKERTSKEYEHWLTEAQETIHQVYDGIHHLVIGVQPGFEKDAQEAKEKLLTILGDSIKIMTVGMSPHAHGPRGQLPHKDEKNLPRANLRRAEWADFIRQIRLQQQNTGEQVDGVLMIAAEWYPGNQHDDHINKRVARVTVAEGLGVPVQYLRPRDEKAGQVTPRKGKKKTEEEIEEDLSQQFETRLMVAWLDLAFKSVGRVKPAKIRQGVDAAYKDAPYSLYGNEPDKVIALGTVQRNKRRKKGNDASFFPYAIELDVQTGVCQARFAYEENRQVIDTGFMPMPKALVTLAGLGPIQLTSAGFQEVRKERLDRTQHFFKTVLDEYRGGRRALRPLVLVDADTSRSYWPWLQDVNIDPSNILLIKGHAESAWPHTRMVRVRTKNSPKLLWDKRYFGDLAEEDGTPTGETVSYHAPKAAVAQLFKLKDSKDSQVYLSFGSAIRKYVGGTTCYQQTIGMEQKKEKDEAGKTNQVYRCAPVRFQDKAWQTPEGVEFVVVRRADDQPDRLAMFTEWLRQCYAHLGGWTSQPAPMSFAPTLKSYLADFDLDELEDQQVEIQASAAD